MKIVCIDNTIGNSKHFKIGQIVEARELTEEEKRKCKPNIYYYIIDGKYSKTSDEWTFTGALFNEIWCERRCFISLEEWRETKLNKLLI
jgi:hypothetical protein